jgi:glycosyltransferase involved in cell wall biosynthesis
MPRVAIVVPAYNGEAYLFECLASIAAQTYSDWEAIIVNNCSTDRTGVIADNFAKQDSRFRVAHCSEFLSQSENYNRAVKFGISVAKYVKMVEADNVLRPQCLEKMVALAETDREIGVVGCYWFHGEGFRGEALPPQKEVVDGREVLREHLQNYLYYLGTPTTLLFRAAALASVNPWFPPGLFFDDVDLCFRVLQQWKFGFVHQPLAFVRADNDGLFDTFADFDYIPAYRYLLATTYSKQLFDSGQAKEVTEKHKSTYYQTLGYALVHGRPRAYWEFHKEAFRLMGQDFGYLWVIRWALLLVLELIYNSKAVLIMRRPARQVRHWCGESVRWVVSHSRPHKKGDQVVPPSR